MPGLTYPDATTPSPSQTPVAQRSPRARQNANVPSYPQRPRIPEQSDVFFDVQSVQAASRPQDLAPGSRFFGSTRPTYDAPMPNRFLPAAPSPSRSREVRLYTPFLRQTPTASDSLAPALFEAPPWVRRPQFLHMPSSDCLEPLVIPVLERTQERQRELAPVSGLPHRPYAVVERTTERDGLVTSAQGALC